MVSEEIGFAELKRLAWRHWKLIVGLAVAAGLAVWLASMSSPLTYTATARLMVYPITGDEKVATRRPVALYRSLLTSDSLLEKTTAILKGDGTLPEDAVLALDRNLYFEVSDEGSILELTVRGTSAQGAAAVANAWAQVFIQESQSLPRSTSAASEVVLEQELSPTRQRLEEMEAERFRLWDEFQEREAETATRWDRRISATQKKAERAVTDFHIETRRLMEEKLARYFTETSETRVPAPDSQAGGVGDDVRTQLLEIVSVRAELAKTPRVLTLEKAASDETLAEALIEGKSTDHFDNTLISQEMNPLYDQLSVSALQLDGDLKRISGPRLAEVSLVLGDLEKTQLERAADLAALMTSNGLELRILRRQRSFALQDLEREESTTIARYVRKIDQLKDLEARIADRLNSVFISGLFEDVDIVHMASAATPPPRPESRQAILKVAAASFLGGMLGLMIALFRSSGG